MTPTNAWQGADLSAQVPLQAGQTYWMVWGTTAGSQSSILPPQAVPGQVIRVSLDGGQSWGPQIQANERHFKFRLFCGCSGPAASYGQGCAGTGGGSWRCWWRGLGEGGCDDSE